FPVDPDGDEHRARADHAILAHLFVTRIEDEIRILGLQLLAGKALQLRIELRVELADRARAKLVAAKLLADGLDLAGRNALHIHLHQRRHQRLLTALVAFENLGAETPRAILRHAQLESAHARDQLARVIAAAIAQPLGAAFTLACAKRFIHLRFEELLHGDLHDRAQEILVFGHEGFEFTHGFVTTLSGHGFVLGSGCLLAPVPTMTRFLFAELSGHYREELP